MSGYNSRFQGVDFLVPVYIENIYHSEVNSRRFLIDEVN